MAAARTTAKADREREDLKGVSNQCLLDTLPRSKVFFSSSRTYLDWLISCFCACCRFWGRRRICPCCPASASSRSLSGGGGESETRFYASILPPFPFPLSLFPLFPVREKRRREGLFRFRRPRRRRQGEDEDGARPTKPTGENVKKE